jgi:hypothetical protein
MIYLQSLAVIYLTKKYTSLKEILKSTTVIKKTQQAEQVQYISYLHGLFLKNICLRYFFIYALDYSEISNVLLEWLTPLLRIREVLGSNLGPEVLTEVSVVFLSPSRHMPGQYLKLGHDRFCHILFISSLFITLSFDSV